MDMGEKIHQLRKEKGLTLEELGEKVGVGKSTVRKWEQGMIKNMRRDKILNVALALNVSPEYLMGWTSDPKSTEADPIIVETGVPIETLSRIRIQGEAVALTDPDEIELIEAYRSQPPIIRNAARRVLGLKEDGSGGKEESGIA